MLKCFTKEYYLSHRGCYSREKMQNLVEVNAYTTITDFLNWPIPIKDKFYFVRNYTELTIKDKQKLALMCAKVSVEIYELKYPKDNRIRTGVEAIEKFLNNKIDINQFNIFRTNIREARRNVAAAAAADAADAAAYAADAAAYAAYAAADAAAYAAYATAAAAAYAANDAAANDAYADKYWTNKLLQALKDFCKNT